MKKVKTGELFDYSPTILTKQDIKDIFEIFRNNFSDIKVTIENYELDHIEEIDTMPLKIAHNFKIHASSPSWIYIEGRPYLLRIHLSDLDDALQVGVKTQIEKIISARTTWTKKHYIYGLAIIAGVLSSIISAFTIQDFWTRSLVAVIGSVVLSFILVSIIERLFPGIKNTTIILDDTGVQLNFWKKNKESITVGLLVTIIGGLILIFIDKFFFK
jgi:hypothetical protein